MKTVFITSLFLTLHAIALGDVIPGLQPVDVYLNLEGKGFATEKNFASATGKEFTEFTCRKDDGVCRFTVIIYIPKGHTSEVAAVSGVVQNVTGAANATDQLSAPFLSYLATLTYEGGEPAAAAVWATANMGRDNEKFFGPAKIESYHEDRVRVLRVSMDPLKETAPTPSTLPTVKHLDQPKVKDENARLPEVGKAYAEVIAEHGKPSIQDPDTGWAIWTSFKVKFKDGKAAEVAR
jgi:hypothetical protein